MVSYDRCAHGNQAYKQQHHRRTSTMCDMGVPYSAQTTDCASKIVAAFSAVQHASSPDAHILALNALQILQLVGTLLLLYLIH